MVNTYGVWTYEKNTAEEKKCDCDRLADLLTLCGICGIMIKTNVFEIERT